ncbi:MAG: hypothetical protein ABSF98_08225 [Bryobacteraceae bacterium]
MVAMLTSTATGKSMTCLVQLDSGADQCVFPATFMGPLGLDLLKMKMQFTGGVGCQANPTYYETIHIKIVTPPSTSLSFTLYAGFTPGLDAHGMGLMGQLGFFENCQVAFDLANKQFHIDVP